MFKLFASGVDDLVLVSSPSNGEITAQIGARFDREIIYTNIGDVLIAVCNQMHFLVVIAPHLYNLQVNPYKSLPNTGPEFVQMYQFSTASGGDAPPHIFKVSNMLTRLFSFYKCGSCFIVHHYLLSSYFFLKRIFCYIYILFSNIRTSA